MFLCSIFWVNFWPNFAATIIGIIIGLPVALLVNRIIISWQNKKQRREDSERLNAALEIIKQTLTENLVRLKTTKDLLNDNKIQYDMEYDISAWDVVKSDIIQYLSDSRLKKRIAYHFSRLAAIVSTNNLFLGQNTGIDAAIRNSEQTRASIKNHLFRMIEFLKSDSEEILDLINATPQQ